jgi:hypothetical protein
VPAPPAPSPTERVIALSVPDRARQVQLISGAPAEAARELVKRLRDDRVI